MHGTENAEFGRAQGETAAGAGERVVLQLKVNESRSVGF